MLLDVIYFEMTSLFNLQLKPLNVMVYLDYLQTEKIDCHQKI